MPGREVSRYESGRLSPDTRRAVTDLEEWTFGQEVATRAHHYVQRQRIAGTVALVRDDVVPGVTAVHNQISQASHEKPLLEAALREVELDLVDDCRAIVRDFVRATDYLDGGRHCLAR